MVQCLKKLFITYRVELEVRIVFIGTVEFSYNALKKLLEEDYEVVGVLTKSESVFNADFKDLTPLCKQYNVPIKYVEDINASDSINFIKSVQPDAVYCFGWSQIIRQELLNLSRLGVIGFHPAELPKNRGRHPIIWALVLGLKQTASSFFFMDKGADSGELLSQRIIPISANDTARTLYDQITEVALTQISEFTKALASGNYERKKQDHSLANIWRKRSKKDGKIDFRMSAKSIHNLVKALTRPYVGAHYEDEDGNEYKIWETVVCDEIQNAENYEYGKVLMSDSNSFTVKCGEGIIRITKHEFTIVPKAGDYL